MENTHDNEEFQPAADLEESQPALDLNRRQFLGGVGGVTVGSLAGGLVGIGALTTARRARAEEIGPEEPSDRLDTAERIREDAARAEKELGVFPHPCNGDEELYPNRIGNYHKGLPHDANGFVDTAAYNTLRGAIATGTYAAFEAVPLAGAARLVNPLGALAFNLEGPDNPATSAPAPPPALNSPERAAEAAELYWMALCRDIPFPNYATDATVADACADLNNLPGYSGPVDPVTGTVTPQVLFRWQAPGVLHGPMTSQFLMRQWVFDGAVIAGRVNTAAVGGDFMTDYNEWLTVQNGGGVAPTPPLDPVTRLPRSGRDLAMVASFDKVYTAYLKACHVLLQFINFANGAFCDANWPYRTATKQVGFATFGLAWMLENVAAVGKGERHCWYQKWNVHRTIRPEAYGGLVHKAVADGLDLPIHSDLTDVSTVLPRVFAANQARNAARGLPAVGTYLLSQHIRTGCPTHPSFPAGHAFSAGASVTFLKAMVDEAAIMPGPVKPSADGLTSSPYVVGVDGPALTLGGELNKLAHNLSFGRDMSGVHWRSDDVAGLAQGEEVAIRYMAEQRATYAEPFAGFTLTKFDGTTITI